MAERAASSSHGGGFSVDAGVRIEAIDRAGLERLKQRGADLVYRCGKGHSELLQSDKYAGELVLTLLELINRIAQLVPPPRTHRHRYYGVLAPNSPLRAAVTAMVPMLTRPAQQSESQSQLAGQVQLPRLSRKLSQNHAHRRTICGPR